MALSKRNSRPIAIDDKRYRYCVSLGPHDGDYHFVLNITAQIDSGEGSKLRVVGLRTRDVWVDFPNVAPDEQWAEAYKIVKPGHVANFVKIAIADGWEPDTSGQPFDVITNGGLPGDDNQKAL